MIDADATNGAALHAQLARALRAENAALHADLARVLALVDTGASNNASWRVLPMAAVLPFPPRRLAVAP